MTVDRISVRYLNFIEIDSDESVNELIKINLQHPFGANIQNQFTQQRFKNVDDPSIEITIVSATGKTDNQNGIVLDIILNKRIEGASAGNFNFAIFNTMRAIKNELFFQCITEKTINKYNQ